MFIVLTAEGQTRDELLETLRQAIHTVEHLSSHMKGANCVGMTEHGQSYEFDVYDDIGFHYMSEIINFDWVKEYRS